MTHSISFMHGQRASSHSVFCLRFFRSNQIYLSICYIWGTQACIRINVHHYALPVEKMIRWDKQASVNRTFDAKQTANEMVWWANSVAEFTRNCVSPADGAFSECGCCHVRFFDDYLWSRYFIRIPYRWISFDIQMNNVCKNRLEHRLFCSGF